MWHRRLSRRALLALGGSALASVLLGTTTRQRTERRIGVVLPWAREGFRLDTKSVEMAGNSARRGAVLAEEELSGSVDGGGVSVVYASAPNADSADRAARRMAAIDGVFALVGGFGEGQARAINRAAQDHGVLFMNAGSTSESLRAEECGRHTFHVEAAASTYLSGLIRWFESSAHRRWFIVHARDEEGRDQLELARREIARHAAGPGLVGTATVVGSGDFDRALAEIREAAPDVALLLLGWREQLEFIGHSDAAELSTNVTGFPHPATQTYEFATSLQRLSPRNTLGHRVVLWSPALGSERAKQLNSRFFSRWGLPMDAPAWSTYQSVAILARTAATFASTDSGRLIEHLESETTEFDVGKGKQVSFGALDHQLRQPLYVVRPQPTATGASPLGVVDRLFDHTIPHPADDDAEVGTGNGCYGR